MLPIVQTLPVTGIIPLLINPDRMRVATPVQQALIIIPPPTQKAIGVPLIIPLVPIAPLEVACPSIKEVVKQPEVQQREFHLTDNNKSMLFEIFQVIKSITGRSHKEMRTQSADPRTILAQKLLVLLLDHYNYDPYLTCHFLRRDSKQIDVIWNKSRKDRAVRHTLEMAVYAITGLMADTDDPRIGVANFTRSSEGWFRTLSSLQLRDLVSYVEFTLTGVSKRGDCIASARCLYFLSCHPSTRKRLFHCLAMGGLSKYIGLVDTQIKNAGYKLR